MSPNMVTTGPLFCRRGRRERGRASSMSDTRNATSSVATDQTTCLLARLQLDFFCSVGGGTGRGGGPVASPTTTLQPQAPHLTAATCPPSWLQLDLCFVREGDERGGGPVAWPTLGMQLHVSHPTATACLVTRPQLDFFVLSEGRASSKPDNSPATACLVT